MSVSPRPTPPSGALVGVVVWDIGTLPGHGHGLAAAHRDIAALVVWLRALGRQVLACWYVHPRVVERLLLLLHWRAIALIPQPRGDHPKCVVARWAVASLYTTTTAGPEGG
jgi:hypothetical protein